MQDFAWGGQIPGTWGHLSRLRKNEHTFKTIQPWAKWSIPSCFLKSFQFCWRTNWITTARSQVLLPTVMRTCVESRFFGTQCDSSLRSEPHPLPEYLLASYSRHNFPISQKWSQNGTQKKLQGRVKPHPDKSSPYFPLGEAVPVSCFSISHSEEKITLKL